MQRNLSLGDKEWVDVTSLLSAKKFHLQPAPTPQARHCLFNHEAGKSANDDTYLLRHQNVHTTTRVKEAPKKETFIHLFHMERRALVLL